MAIKNSKSIILVLVLLLLVYLGNSHFLKGQVKEMEQSSQKIVLNSSSLRTDDDLDLDPDGCYIPSTELIIGDYQIDHFYLETSTYDIKTSTLKKLENPNAYIGLTNSITKKFELYSCPNPQISKSKLLIKSESTPIGIITIAGDFSDKIKSYFVTVFTGVVSVEEEGRVENLGQYDFTYSEGD